MPTSFSLVQMFCECISSNAPNTAAILEQLETHQICTSTQCFENDTDAFGVHLPPGGISLSMHFGFMMWLMCVAMYLSQYAPRHGIKPIASSSHDSFDDDPEYT